MWWLNRIDENRLVSMTNRSDVLSWQNQLGKNEALKKVFTNKLAKHHGMDLFNVLWRLHPQLKSPGLVEDKAYRAWLNRLTKSEEYQKLHDKTLQSKEIAAAATVRVYKKFKQDASSQLNMIERLHQNIKDAQELGSQELVEGLQEALDQIATSIDTSKMPASESQAIMQAGNEVEGVMDFVQAMVPGGKQQGLAGDPFSMAADMLGMENVIRQLQRKDFKHILEIAGRMTAILENKRKTGVHRSAVPMDITQGDTLDKVLPSELSLLIDTELEDIFLHKLTTKTLLQYEIKSKQAEGRGPIVFCCDHSGSMHGEPMNLAMGIMVAMAREAVRENRPLAYIPFASYTEPEPVMITNPLELANAIGNSYRIGGGTDFQKPFTLATRTIKNSEKMQKADIVFISDGIAHLYPEFIEQFIQDKNDLNFKNLGISIHSRFYAEQLPMYDGIMHMGYDMHDLKWFEEFANYYDQGR